jgi:aminoglycoside 6'-N-acetyltransferase
MTALSLRPMTEEDLGTVEGWMLQPHVARWWLEDSTLEEELADCRRAVHGEGATHVLMVLDHGRPIGWCQWYRLSDYPDYAAEVDARPGEVGIDYAIGEPEVSGRGVGTSLIAELVTEVRSQIGGVGFVVDPAADNVASRRVLERNGFELVDEREVDGQWEAIYRLEATQR